MKTLSPKKEENVTTTMLVNNGVNEWEWKHCNKLWAINQQNLFCKNKQQAGALFYHAN